MNARRTLVDLSVALVAIAGIALVLEIWTRTFRVPSYLLPAPSSVAARMVADAGLLAREGSITLGDRGWFRSGHRHRVRTSHGDGLVATHRADSVSARDPREAHSDHRGRPALHALVRLRDRPESGDRRAHHLLPDARQFIRRPPLGRPSGGRLLQTLGASGREIFRHLRVPSALPYLFSGARISVNLALIGAVIGEWTGADRRLGRIIFVANANLDLTALFGAVLVLAAIGIAANALVGAAERRVLHWHPIAVAT